MSKHTTELLTGAEVAEEFKIPQRTLGQWRYRGLGPRYVKVGKHVRYKRDAIEEFLVEQTVEPSPAA